MINFISSWSEQIVLAVVTSTIIEMLLPQNKNKKYIQMVIGVYVLFNIISPVVKNKEQFYVEKYNIENYESQHKANQTSIDSRIEKIYLDELENTVISKFEKNNIKVLKCDIDAILDTTNKNAGIHSIIVKIMKGYDETKVSEIKAELASEFEIKENIIIIKT